MAEFIIMPTLGFDMEEGTMGGWLKQVGDAVSKGDVLAEIESDKVTQELQARADGVLLAQFVQEGDQVPVGSQMGIIGAAGEDISGMQPADGGSRAAAAPEPQAEAAPAAAPAAAAPAAAPSAAHGDFPGGIKATPVARRVAQEKGINLQQVAGSGPGGRVRKADVEAFSAAPAAPAPAAAAPVAAGPDSTTVAFTRLRKAIGRRMGESKMTVPHFYVTSEIDMAPALALRKQVNEMLPPEKKVTVNDLIVKATGVALRDFPNLNASFAGDNLVLHQHINVGSAVAVEGGLLTVVQKDTDKAPLSQIAADHKGMIARAREGKVRPEDVSGGTFTVSNLGAFEVENFIAIINPPEAAILAVGSARQVPVVVDGELTVGVRMKATISADHRVTDGAEAAQFMQRFKALLEEPLGMLV